MHRRCSAPGDQALAGNAGQMSDDVRSLFARRRLNHRQVEPVTGELLQTPWAVGELNEKGASLALAARQAFEVAQQGWLMVASKQNAWGTRGLVGRQRAQTNTGTWATHGDFSASQIPLGSGGRRHRTSALAVFRTTHTRAIPRPASSCLNRRKRYARATTRKLQAPSANALQSPQRLATRSSAARSRLKARKYLLTLLTKFTGPMPTCSMATRSVWKNH